MPLTACNFATITGFGRPPVAEYLPVRAVFTRNPQPWSGPPALSKGVSVFNLRRARAKHDANLRQFKCPGNLGVEAEAALRPDICIPLPTGPRYNGLLGWQTK